MRDVLFVAPVLPVDVQRQAETLDAAGRLRALITRYLPSERLRVAVRRWRVTGGFASRPASPVDRKRVTQVRRADVVYEVVKRATGSRLLANDLSFETVDRAARARVDRGLATVLGREDCCRLTFAAARRHDVATGYLLQTAYWGFVRDLMANERQQFPDVCTASEDEREYAENRNERKDAEIALADSILCPSTFAKSTLSAFGGSQPLTSCLPFGCDMPPAPTEVPRRYNVLLYAGNITMRKGMHRVLRVWRELKAYKTHELRLVGEMFLKPQFLRDFNGMYTHVPRILRRELVHEYRCASAFVFNAMADGFGNVVLEAMACGTPVIASRNCGAPDVITDGLEGLLTDYGDDAALACSLERMLSRPADAQTMGDAAAHKASHCSWESYAARFLEWLENPIS